MTAVLEQIRRLEAARARGDLDDAAFERAKSVLIDAVEEANTPAPAPTRPAPKPAQPSKATAWEIVLAGLAVLILLTGIAALLLDDLMLAITGGVVILAAITVQAFRTLED